MALLLSVLEQGMIYGILALGVSNIACLIR